MKSYHWIEQQTAGFGWAIFEFVTTGQSNQNAIRFHVVQVSEKANQVRRGNTLAASALLASSMSHARRPKPTLGRSMPN